MKSHFYHKFGHYKCVPNHYDVTSPLCNDYSITSLKSLCSIYNVSLSGTLWQPLLSSAGKFGTRTSLGLSAGKFTILTFKGSKTAIALKIITKSISIFNALSLAHALLLDYQLRGLLFLLSEVLRQPWLQNFFGTIRWDYSYFQRF